MLQIFVLFFFLIGFLGNQTERSSEMNKRQKIETFGEQPLHAASRSGETSAQTVFSPAVMELPSGRGTSMTASPATFPSMTGDGIFRVVEELIRWRFAS